MIIELLFVLLKILALIAFYRAVGFVAFLRYSGNTFEELEQV